MIRALTLCAIALALVGVNAMQTQTTQKRDPRSVRLRGDRFKPLTYDEMTPAQKALIEHVLASPRSGVEGPFNVLLRSPEMGIWDSSLAPHDSPRRCPAGSGSWRFS